MGLSSLNHFEISEDSPLDYTFVNRDGIVYHATFFSVSMLYPEFKDTFAFSIEPEDKKAHPIDVRISNTIAEILRRFFNKKENAMIMVCDSSDGKEHKRRMLFDRWYDKFSNNEIAKYDASAPLEEYQLLFSLYLRKDNPNRSILLKAFNDILKSDLYGLAF